MAGILENFTMSCGIANIIWKLNLTDSDAPKHTHDIQCQSTTYKE